MLLLALAAVGAASAAEPPPEGWSCSNPIEVRCSAEECSAESEAFTPMSVSVSAAGGFSVCAYTGCWEGVGAPARQEGRLLWTGDDLPFSTSQDGGMQADVTLLLVEKDGLGFVRVAGFASPLLCERAEAWPEEPAQDIEEETEAESEE
ncbi:MAG: hypothetical protein RIE56_06970 [Amphiplicatus sp.]